MFYINADNDEALALFEPLYTSLVESTLSDAAGGARISMQSAQVRPLWCLCCHMTLGEVVLMVGLLSAAHCGARTICEGVKMAQGVDNAAIRRVWG